MKIDSILSNPYLGYRLDPYEPGLIHSAKASESTMQVTAQERRNLNRLVSEAAREGRSVVREGIAYQPTIAGSYMGTAAGKTTVISIEKPEKKASLALDDSQKSAENAPAPGRVADQNQAGQTGGLPASESAFLDPELSHESLDDLKEQELTLQAKVAALESQLQEADQDLPEEADAATAGQIAWKKRRLYRELEEKQEELNKIALAKLIKRQADLMTIINQGFMRNSLAPLAMVKTAYGAGSESTAQGSFDQII